MSSFNIPITIDVYQLIHMLMNEFNINIPDDFDRTYDVVYNKELDQNVLVRKSDGKIVSDDADLMIAMMNLINCVTPNYENRGSKYIWTDVDYDKVDLKKAKGWYEELPSILDTK